MRRYWFSMTEIGKYLGISRQRAWQLAAKNSPRIAQAAKDLDIAEKLAERAKKAQEKAS